MSVANWLDMRSFDFAAAAAVAHIETSERTRRVVGALDTTGESRLAKWPRNQLLDDGPHERRYIFFEPGQTFRYSVFQQMSKTGSRDSLELLI